MGLDMYFEVRISDYKSSYNEEVNYPENLKGLERYIEIINFKSVSSITSYKVGYFRKFNALHNYIVEHFADGIDECQKIYLDKDNIRELWEICDKIKLNHTLASSLLPTANGFFFGSQDYDEWYFQNVELACSLFNFILQEVDFDESQLIYQASW